MRDKVKQEVFDLYDDYVHSKIDRKDFIRQLGIYAVGGLTVPALLDYLMPNYQDKIQIAVDDPRLNTSTISYDSPDGCGTMNAQLSLPKDTNKLLSGVIIVHENRGLNPHIADVGRRAALAGFISIAPDALSPLGGYPGTDDEGRIMQRERDRMEMLNDFIAAFNYLKGHEKCNGTIGVVGFCFGGWISNMMAVNVAELAAAVPFYGGQPEAADVPKIQAPLLLHFAENDKRVNEGWPAYEEALKANDKTYIAHMYPGVNHGFHNDTTARYNIDAATLAWDRTIAFFTKYLGT